MSRHWQADGNATFGRTVKVTSAPDPLQTAGLGALRITA